MTSPCIQVSFFCALFWFVYHWIYVGLGQYLFTLLIFVTFPHREYQVSIFSVRALSWQWVEDTGLKSALNEHRHCAVALPWHFPIPSKIKVCATEGHGGRAQATLQELMDQTAFCCSTRFSMCGLLPPPTFLLHKAPQAIFGF